MSHDEWIFTCESSVLSYIMYACAHAHYRVSEAQASKCLFIGYQSFKFNNK